MLVKGATGVIRKEANDNKVTDVLLNHNGMMRQRRLIPPVL